ncbi:ComEC/Rec2 family competence protein [Bifidobacterium sp. ESL0763]|uniref:ComEC/Rec2 family competence protein n=1 Tax=Bifidobacterium sp. ESL0763 TaxID=2983227 RepID=UPI0023F924C0|nr:ComEC/Rec2 family competence protein [Bifidobacterium sp. ESL0763]MDF7663761.1 ComEC/Rec2 family competence protein [Bifidobacterium sp. ESL0763]
MEETNGQALADSADIADSAGVSSNTDDADADRVKSGRVPERAPTRRHGIWLAGCAALAASVPRRSVGTWGLVLVCVTAISSLACLASEVSQFRDPAVVLARQGRATVGARVRLTSPATASNSFEADCQARARLKGIRHDGVDAGSAATLTLYADQPDCAKLDDGEAVAVKGTLEQARFGIRPLSLSAGEGMVRPVARASPPQRMVASMQRSFFSVTEGLSEQGRVLVPGLTIGLLGQDFMGPTSREPVDQTFATLLQRRFKDSGIMHLMAVSGGHFALIGELVRLGCAWLLLPRRPVSWLTMLAYVALAAAMYPSDSVLRALVMGVIVCLARMAGRRPQALSALSWTVIATLLADPAMARSFGFALSSASVLGIVLCASRLAGWMATLLPGVLAEGIAVTLAAQMFTLPIQVLMDPQLPLLSVPANLIVAPFVDFSTLTGLTALLLAGCLPRVAFAFAWASSCGTVVMRWCADTIGSRTHATMPWAGGIGGALAVVLAEVVAVLSAQAFLRWLRYRRREDGVDVGSRFAPNPKSKIVTWLGETRQMLRQNEDGAGPDDGAVRTGPN